MTLYAKWTVTYTITGPGAPTAGSWANEAIVRKGSSLTVYISPAPGTASRT